MNAKDLATMNEAIAAAVAPLIEEINALQQRTANFATRVNADRAKMLTVITQLREQVENQKPVTKTAPAERITTDQWNAAMAVLRLQHPDKRFFDRADVVATAKTLTTAPAQAPVETPVTTLSEDEEVCF